jgi:hypothetical protein
MSESRKFYVVRGYDKDGKQVEKTCKLTSPELASVTVEYMLGKGCKSVDIDLIESSDESCGT